MPGTLSGDKSPVVCVVLGEMGKLVRDLEVIGIEV